VLAAARDRARKDDVLSVDVQNGEHSPQQAENVPVPPDPFKKYSLYPGIIDQLDLAASMIQAKRNDLLPPRPDDRAGGQVGDRFVEALKHSLANPGDPYREGGPGQCALGLSRTPSRGQ
jgi:hypothetical protein